MLFPAADRVVYDPNPLDNVICQVRFPPILRIDTDPPSAFQDRLLPEYDDLTEGEEVVFEVRLGSRRPIPREELEPGPSPAVRNYQFSTEDGKWRVNLTRQFLSLSTPKYTRWEDFKDRFEKILGSFLEVYKPAVFTRIGLRYVDIVVRSKLGLADVDWTKLILPPALGFLGSDVKASVKQLQSATLLDLGDGGSEARVVAGTVQSAETNERCFVVDGDYYDLKRRKAEEIMGRLEFLHTQAYGLFRWCMTDRLHNAMNPKKVK